MREALSGNLCRCTGYQHIVDGGALAARADAGLTPWRTRNFGAPITRNEDRAPAAPARRCSSTTSSCPACCMPRSCAATSRMRASASIDVSRGAAARRAWSRSTRRQDLGAYWQPGPLLVPPPPIAGIDLQPAHAGAARQGQGAPRRRAARGRGGREPLPRRGRARRHRGRARAAAGGGRSGSRRWRRARRWCTTIVRRATSPRTCARRKGDYAAARAAAPITSSARRFRYDRGASSPIETRGIVAQWDARANQLTVWDTTQAPVFLRNGLAGMLGLSERQVRVIAPFVGGGFGPKIMMFYPEEVLIPWAAMQLNRPVKWIEDRLEHFFATTQERGADPRRRDRARARRPHPRRQGRRSCTTPAPTIPTA